MKYLLPILIIITSCNQSAEEKQTQGRKGAYERSKIPEQLCIEILKSAQL